MKIYHTRMEKTVNTFFIKIRSAGTRILYSVIVIFLINIYACQIASSQQLPNPAAQSDLISMNEQVNPGWYFHSYFLKVELENSLSSLYMSRVEESPKNGDIWALGAGQTTSGDYIGLLFRSKNGNWETIDVFDLVYQDGTGVQSLPMFVSSNGSVYYSDGYNLRLNMYSYIEDSEYTPENSGMPEPAYDQERMVDIIQDNVGRIWFLYSTPRLMRFNSTGDWEIFDHNNSEMPESVDSLGIEMQQPARHLAVTGNDLWITTHQDSSGLIRKTGDDWTHYTTENSDLPSDLVSSVVAQSDNQLWISTLPTEFNPTNGGLVHLEDDNWTVYTTDNGLPDNFVRLHSSESDTYLWASFGSNGTEDNTHSGFLAEFDGESWNRIAEEDEFYKSIGWLAVDSHQNKWLAGDFNVIKGGVASLNQSFLTFTDEPEGSSIYESGTEVSYRWETGSKIERVSFSYSSDDGDTWNLIENNIDADQFSYSFALPGVHDTEIIIKISNDVNEDVFDESKPLSIIDPDQPYYHLRKLQSDGSYELYDPVIHGWNMSNSKAVMFPEEKWQDIVYEGPLDRILKGKSSDFPTFNSLIRAFGEDEAIFGYTPFFENIIPTLKGGVLWKSLTSNGFSGVCHGFSVTSLIAFNDGNSSLRNLGASISTQNLYDAEVNNDIRKMINMIWVRQFSRDHFIQIFINALNENLVQNLFDKVASGDDITLEELLETDLIFAPPSQKLPQILAMLDNEASEESHRSLTLIPEGNISGGHSVVAYKAEQSEDNPDIWKIFIHDSNFADANPEDDDYDIHDIYIEVDLEEDYYRHMEDSRFEGSIGLFLTDPVDNYKTTSTLLKDLPEKDGNSLAEIEGLDDIGFMHTLFSPDMDIRITDAMGHISSLEDGSTTYDIPGSFPIVPLVGGLHDPIGYFLADLEYEIELEYPADSEGELNLFTGDTIYGYINHNPEVGSVDQLRYGNSLSVFGADQTFDLEVTHANGADQRMFSLRELTVSDEDSVNVTLLNDTELEFKNHGKSISANLELRTNWDGEGYFLFEDLELDESAGYKLSVPNWDDIGNKEVTLSVDSNLDGEYDDSKPLTSMTVSNSEETDRKQDIPGGFELHQNYPNPFNPTTQISYDIPIQTHVKLSVYNALGQRVATLVDAAKAPGKYDATFDASGLSSGIYFYRIQTDSHVQTRQMMLVK